MELDEKQLLITDEDGVEYKMEILFTYENEQRGKKYVLCYPSDDEESLFAFTYDDEGNLEEVVEEEELSEIEEVLAAFEDNNGSSDEES